MEGDRWMSELIKAEDITKVFMTSRSLFGEKKYIKAVDHVSFLINERETISLVGESGCGKSTAGRLAIALMKPTLGRILFRGKDVWNMKKKEFKEFRKMAQIVHQDPYASLNPMRTIFQSLAPALKHHKIVHNRRELEEKITELLEMVGLFPASDFINRYPCRMSGGQMQRVAIARAISVNPSFVMADEAVSMIDASLRIDILNLLLDLKKKFNMAFLFITHDFGVTRYFAKGGKVMIMYLGNIVELGPTDEVILKPLHPYTNILIACAPIADPKLTRSRGLPALRSIEVPNLTDAPSGCKFHPRCPNAKETCSKKIPELVEVSKNRFVACHIS
jgi:oligopeptide/dipeptide ABC transporter ATP-binding protein